MPGWIIYGFETAPGSGAALAQPVSDVPSGFDVLVDEDGNAITDGDGSLIYG